jgi:hypothetical protein
MLRRAFTDHALTVLVGLLLVEAIVVPALAQAFPRSRHGVEAVSLIVLAVGALRVCWHVGASKWFVLFSALSAGLSVLNIWLPDASLRVWDAVFNAAAFASLLILALRYTFAKGPINWHRIMGSVAGFLLIGMTFTQLHRLVAMQVDGAYSLLGQVVGYDAVVPHLWYFSFVTLTSLGFGDIVPLHALARALTVVEALVGVLYPAALLGWLVSLGTREDHGAHD